MPFTKWPSIKKFSDVYHSARRNGVERATLRGKIKLHGTNAAIRISNGEMIAQKRTSDVTPDDDNAGFATWVSNQPYYGGLTMSGMIFFGEWAGPGVIGGDAVAGINSKKFFVFAVAPVTMNTLVIEPEEIANLVAVAFGDNPDILTIPWYTDPCTVRMNDQDDSQKFLDSVTDTVDNVISQCDPYIRETFGVDGPGEGLVFYALDQGEYWTDWMFKVKTDAHTVNKTRKRSPIAPEKPAGIDEFLDLFFTENRFRQILNEQFGGEAERTDTGKFIGAVMGDVHKESENEIDAADFEWKQVARYGPERIRIWFFNQCDKL